MLAFIYYLNNMLIRIIKDNTENFKGPKGELSKGSVCMKMIALNSKIWM